MSRKVVAFTGGSGLLALNLAVLMARDYSVYLFLHNRIIKLQNINTLRVDLNSISEIALHLVELKVDLLINCAALTNVETCEQNPDSALHANSTIANNIAVACSRLGVKLVHISTDHLFDGKQSFYTEDAPVNPLNSYGYSKAVGEEKVLASCPTSLVLRTNFFGWGWPHRKSFSDAILNNLSSSSFSYLFADVFFTPVIIPELLNAIIGLIELDSNGIFNVSSAERISKFDFGFRLAQNFSYSTEYILPSEYCSRSDLTRRPCDMSLSNKKLLSVITGYNDDISNHIKLLQESSNEQHSAGLAFLDSSHR